MPTYLSDEWFEQMNAAAAASEELARTTAEADLTIRQVIREDDATTSYVVRIDKGTVTFRPDGDGPGTPGDADVAFAQDRATAAELFEGSLSVTQALMEGRITVSGNLNALLDNAATLTGFGPAFDGVRADTTYD